MRRGWEPQELIDCWTLLEGDQRLVGNKTGASRLGFALLLKFFELEGRFPEGPDEVPEAAVDYVAAQVRVHPSAFVKYAWSGRTIEYHRAQVRKALGFCEATVGDEDKLTVWLAEEVRPVELSEERLRQALLARCRMEQIEPPAASRVQRILGSTRAAFEQHFVARTVSRLSAESIARLEELVAGEGAGPSVLIELKADPGQLGLDTLLSEIKKLERVRGIGLPADLFAETSEKLVAAWRARAARSYPSDLRDSVPSSPATPSRPGCNTTCPRTGCGTSSSPGSRLKASTTPSSSPTRVTRPAPASRSTLGSHSPTPSTPTRTSSSGSPSECLQAPYFSAGDTDPSAGPTRAPFAVDEGERAGYKKG